TPRSRVLRRTEEDIAGRLHHPLPLDDAAALVAAVAELAAEPLQRRMHRLLDLQEQRLAVAGHEQRDAAEGSDRADADRLEGQILHHIATEQPVAIRTEILAVAGEQRLG